MDRQELPAMCRQTQIPLPLCSRCPEPLSLGTERPNWGRAIIEASPVELRMEARVAGEKLLRYPADDASSHEYEVKRVHMDGATFDAVVFYLRTGEPVKISVEDVLRKINLWTDQASPVQRRSITSSSRSRPVTTGNRSSFTSFDWMRRWSNRTYENLNYRIGRCYRTDPQGLVCAPLRTADTRFGAEHKHVRCPGHLPTTGQTPRSDEGPVRIQAHSSGAQGGHERTCQ